MTDDNKDDKMEDVEVQEEANEKETTSGVNVGKVHLSDAQLPFVGMFFAGLILLVAVCVPGRNTKYWEYGIALASVAMVFALVGFGLTFSESANEKVGKINAYFLFLWCFIGACIMTFSGPFQGTGNGYFASWGLAVCSIVGVGVTASEAKTVVGKMGALLGLGACSIVVVVAIIPPLRDYVDRNICIYALTVACISILVVAVFQKIKGAKMVKVITLGFFALLWIVLAAMVTFRGPFIFTGNGYFASWGGAITSVLATMAALRSE